MANCFVWIDEYESCSEPETSADEPEPPTPDGDGLPVNQRPHGWYRHIGK